MRTIKIERDRWRTLTSGRGKRFLLRNDNGCSCIIGIIAEACGVPVDRLLDHGALFSPDLKKVGVNKQQQDMAIQLNDDPELSLEERETKLKELFKDHFVLEFV